MPKRVSEEKLIKYLPAFSYFGLSVGRRDYILLSAADLMQCTTGRIAVYPINTVLYDVQSLTCEAELFSRMLEITVRAGDVFFTTRRRPFCKDTGQRGYTILQPSGKSPSAVRTVNAGESTRKFSSKPVSYTMLQSVPSHPTKFEHCTNSTEVPTRCWTPLPCIYRRSHQHWRVMRYHNYENFSRRRPWK